MEFEIRTAALVNVSCEVSVRVSEDTIAAFNTGAIDTTELLEQCEIVKLGRHSASFCDVRESLHNDESAMQAIGDDLGRAVLDYDAT